MSLTKERVLEEFGRELDMIESDDIREFATYMLANAPVYFWIVPASSTGKHHPPQDQGQGGLVRHTKAVVYFADRFCRAYDINGRDRDIIITGCLGHDEVKYGFTLTRHTTKTHGKDGADYILALWKDYAAKAIGNEMPREDAVAICKLVAHHLGRWTEGGKKFPEEYTIAEQIVHLADMMSAGKEVSLGFLQQVLIG